MSLADNTWLDFNFMFRLCKIKIY